MPSKKFNKYYSRSTKKGVRRVVMGYNAKGKWGIKKWIDSDTIEQPHGEYRIIEYTINIVPTKDDRPSGNRNFEVRIQLPESDDSENDALEMAKDVLIRLTNEEMVDSSQIDIAKRGVDFIKFSGDDGIKWKVIDTARPQFHYPKTGWGDYDNTREEKEDSDE
jgi:hypothetical protein